MQHALAVLPAYRCKTHTFNLLKNASVQGIIITNPINSTLLNKINAVLPVVQCCEYSSLPNVPFVTIDDKRAACVAVEHILSLGRRRVALLNGSMQNQYARQRQEGYIQTLENAGIAPNPEYIVELPEISYDIAVTAAAHLLSLPEPPDAFFAVSDMYAAGVIKAAIRQGVQVPEDAVVVGFDNVDIASVTTPTITTINHPKYQSGFTSCEILIGRINNPKIVSYNQFLETELIVRESSNTLPKSLHVEQDAGQNGARES